MGQAPSRDTEGRAPFSGRSGRFLCDVLSLPDPALPPDVRLRRAFDLVNLVDRWPGKAGKGDAFPMAEGRAAARAVLAVAPHDRLVLCGANVARCFGVRPDLLASGIVGGKVFLVLPHPSGVNRWWNAPGSRELAARALWDLRSTASAG